MNRLYLFLCFFLLIITHSRAQDVHFSQAYHAPIYMFSGATGFFDGDHRFIANYRQQWASVPVPYTSTAISYDTKINPMYSNGNNFGVSLQFLNDRAGDSKLTLNQLVAGVAYHYPFRKNNIISLGGQIGIAQRRIDLSKLSFDAQFNGDTYNSLLPNGENLTATQFKFLDVNAGIGYTYSKKRFYFRLNADLSHINQPKQSFYEDSRSFLSQRLKLAAETSIPIHKRFDIIGSVVYQEQTTYTQLLGTGLLNYRFLRKPFLKVNLFAGAGLRLNDAFIPVLGIDYNTWRAAVSYDFNYSNFTPATSGRGGIELSLRYIIREVKGFQDLRSCPVF